jgi:hypothetical protein
MYQAKLIRLSNLIEEEVTLEIDGFKIIGFANICPYEIILNQVYPVNISLTFLDGPEIIELDESKHGIERIDNTFRYILYGQVCGNSIDIGKGLKIQDDIFSKSSYLNKKFIRLKVDRLAIEFIQN